jgi:hypothetical protein
MNNPSNLEEAFVLLKEDLSIKDQIEILNMQKDELCRLHNGLGRWIRNNWDLWSHGSMTKFFNNLGIHHADDMSGIIIESFWHHLRNESLDLDNQITYYKEFWASQENK